MSSYRENPTFERPVEIELIRSMSNRKLTAKENKQLDKYLQGPPDSGDAFIIKPAADWLETPEDSNAGMLFGDFWYQGELCIMFADTNVGKSILAVQIGDSLSRGVPIPGIGGGRPAEKVLYFDFELSAA